jgi:MFS family permease
MSLDPNSPVAVPPVAIPSQPAVPLGYASPEMTTKEDVRRLRDLSPQQWKSGIAAWLGWLFDGLDMHLYTIVAGTYVMELLRSETVGLSPEMANAMKNEKAAFIQAAFLIGWALGGGFFGRIGDLLGRSRALSLTILTYALFTGLSCAAQTWWHLMIFRFLAALGIGGEWAVGSSLLSETWPKHWRAWIAAVLQTGVNVGVLIASASASIMAYLPDRYVFLVGVLPACLVFYIRRNVPEPAEWHAAKSSASETPRMLDLFRGPVRRTTILTIIVCAGSLTAWWAIMFWSPQLLTKLPEALAMPEPERKRLASATLGYMVGVSIAGNFLAAWIARMIGYRKAVAAMCLFFFISSFAAFSTPHGVNEMIYFYLPLVGICSGVFGLFTMYLPPLFPTLLRTTGAGFSYNIGRIAAAIGTIVFGIIANDKLGDLRIPLYYASFLFLPVMLVALVLPDLRDGEPKAELTPLPVE